MNETLRSDVRVKNAKDRERERFEKKMPNLSVDRKTKVKTVERME